MSMFFYSHQLGNAFVVGIGKCEIAKFWFGSDDGSSSPLTKGEAKDLAKGLVETLIKTVSKDSLSEEVYGDSDKGLETVKHLNSLSNSLSDSYSDDEDDESEEMCFEDFMKMMLLAKIME